MDNIIEIKMNLLKKIHFNCKKLLDIINADKVEELSVVLNDQENIIDRLKKLDNMVEFKKLNIEKSNEEIEDLLKEIRKLQDDVMKKVNNEKLKLNNKFKQINIGKKAIYGGYIKPGIVNNGHYIDTKIGK